MKKLVPLLAAAALLAGCSEMTQQQKAAGIGTLGGAAGGAVIGALAGNAALGTAIGAGVGLVGGLVYNHVRENQAADEKAAYNRGFTAGQQSHQSQQTQ
jgi:uncharacterized membrane protein